MALPLNPASPANVSSPGLGDDELRALKQWLVDVFGVPVSPSAIAAPIMSVSPGGVVTFTSTSLDAVPGIGARVTRSSVQPILNDVFTPVNWNSEVFDTSNFHDTAVDNHALIVQQPGLYMVSASVIWDSVAPTGQRLLTIVVGGLTIVAAHRIVTDGGNDEATISTIVRANVGQNYSIFVYQNSGVTLNLGATDLNRLSFSIAFLGKLPPA